MSIIEFYKIIQTTKLERHDNQVSIILPKAINC